MLSEGSSLPIQGVSINWNKIDRRSYLRGIEALKDLDYLALNKNITIFVGENGSGKSTMLEAIAVNYGFNPEGGTKNYSFSTYDSHSELCDAIRLFPVIINECLVRTCYMVRRFIDEVKAKDIQSLLCRISS